MAIFIRDILTPVTLTKVVSQVAVDDEKLLEYFGMQPGGFNEVYEGHGREGSFHVFNTTRVPAQGRAPGTAAGRAAMQGVKRVPFVYPRMHEHIAIPMEFLSNLSKIADPTMRDKAALDMVSRQTGFLGQKARNWRIALLVGLLRGSLYLIPQGDTWYPSYETGTGAMQMPIGNMPSGNQGQLDMLGAGAIIGSAQGGGWQNPSADIPLQVGMINAANQQLHGYPLKTVIINFKTFNYVTNNDYVIQKAGTSNRPWNKFERQLGTGPDGRPVLLYTAQFDWAPNVDWIVTDNGLTMGAPGSESFVKHIPDNYAAFSCDPQAPDVFSGYQGAEPIAEYDNGPISEKVGMASWATSTANPTAQNIFVLDNFLPVNHVPGTLAYAKVANF